MFTTPMLPNDRDCFGLGLSLSILICYWTLLKKFHFQVGRNKAGMRKLNNSMHGGLLTGLNAIDALASLVHCAHNKNNYGLGKLVVEVYCVEGQKEVRHH